MFDTLSQYLKDSDNQEISLDGSINVTINTGHLEQTIKYSYF